MKYLRSRKFIRLVLTIWIFIALSSLVDAWLATAQPQSANWDPNCDIASYYKPDGKVDLLDFTMFSKYWLYNTSL